MSTEQIEKDLEIAETKYLDILLELNKLFRREMRIIGVKKNVIPVKYILPRQLITRLLEEREFRIVWNHREIRRKIGDSWITIQTSPNLGGIPVEEGPEMKVIVERVPRRKRRKKGEI